MSVQSAPPGQICIGDSRCSVRARPFSLSARCSTKELDSDLLRLDMPGEHRICSEINPDICVLFNNPDPHTYLNFTTGSPAQCEQESDGSCPGAFCTIFGALFRPEVAFSSTPATLSTVDCQVEFGTAEVVQNGSSTPAYVAGSFDRSTTLVKDEPDMVNWNRIYTKYGRSPYSFDAAYIGRRNDTLYKSSVAYTLLGKVQPQDYGSYVASHFEQSFEMATLMAWAGSPVVADRTYTYTDILPIYSYDRRVLLILLVPLTAMILNLSGRWRVGSSEEVFGYDPIEIAKWGPVTGLEQLTWEERHKADSCEVLGWTDYGSGGEAEEVTGLMGGKFSETQVTAKKPGMARYRFMAKYPSFSPS